jgi:hypothetical protein
MRKTTIALLCALVLVVLGAAGTVLSGAQAAPPGNSESWFPINDRLGILIDRNGSAIPGVLGVRGVLMAHVDGRWQRIYLTGPTGVVPAQ